MWERLKHVWPNPTVLRKTTLAAGAAGLLVLAFCWGRWGALPEVSAQNPVNPPGLREVGTNSRSPVAYIYNSVPITREELGEYLIARFGADRVEFLVNHRIIERVCQARNVVVTDAEIEAQLAEDLRNMNVARVEDFVSQVLRRFNKTLYEYKEDVIRPRLALTKLVRDRIEVKDEDLRKAFEAHFGPKVRCKMIALAKQMPLHEKLAVWTEVRKGEAEFDKVARGDQQAYRELAAKGGEVPPIHMHFGDDKVEKAAFALRPGEVSPMLEMEKDGTVVILRCVEQIPAEQKYKLEDERLMLSREVFQVKLSEEIPKYFKALRDEADPKVFLGRESYADLMRRTDELLGSGPRVGPATAPGLSTPMPAPAPAPVQGN
jgi:hypothetical protein